jgi:hypothetical protein
MTILIGDLVEWRITTLEEIIWLMVDRERKYTAILYRTDNPEYYLLYLIDMSGLIVESFPVHEFTKIKITKLWKDALVYPRCKIIKQNAHGVEIVYSFRRTPENDVLFEITVAGKIFRVILDEARSLHSEPIYASPPNLSYLLEALLKSNVTILTQIPKVFDLPSSEVEVEVYDIFYEFVMETNPAAFFLWDIETDLFRHLQYPGNNDHLFWVEFEEVVNALSRSQMSGYLLVALTPYALCPVWSITYPYDISSRNNHLREDMYEQIKLCGDLIAQGFGVSTGLIAK